MASHLVGQHQQTSFATPVNGAAGDATVVLGNDNATVTTYNAHDIDPTIHVQDSSAAVFGATPAGTAGRKWMTNDTGAIYLYFDTGSAWVEVNYQRTSSTGAVVIVSTSTPQLTVEYDGSHTSTFSVSSAGALTINATSTVTITPATTITGALTQTGLATFNGGVTVAAGTTAVQALTATTVSATSGYVSTGLGIAAGASQLSVGYSGGGLIIAYGANASTNATFSIQSRRSDASNAITLISSDVSGNMTCAANVTAVAFFTSSLRSLKQQITPFQGSALKIVRDTDIYGYAYNSDPSMRRVGWMADSTHELLAGSQHDRMDLPNAVGLLMQAVKELAAENDVLRARLV